MRTVRIKQNSGERGTEIAELAMVLPLLTFLALIVSEGAGFVRVHQVLNNAALCSQSSAMTSETGKPSRAY